MSTPITAHFTVEEFACHDGTPYPPAWIDSRLRPLCNALETLRAELGDHPIHILSGYRTPQYNRSISGAAHSQHCEGRAADITIGGLKPSDVHAAILRLFHAGAVEIGGLGLYPSWVHVDVRPRPSDGHLARWSDVGVSSETA